MKIFFITSKLNFRTAGGSIEEFDLMIRTLIELGNDVTAVTLFSYANDIPNPLPYKLIEENVTARGLLGIQKGIFKVLRKYSDQADFFHVDGHNFLYGAGLYRLLGGRVPVSAFFNRELSSWPENISGLFGVKKDNLFIRLKKKLRRQIEKYFFMPIAGKLDILLYTNPVLKEAYEDFGMRKDPQALIIGDPIDYQKIYRENHILPDDYLRRNKKKGPITLFYSSRMAPGKGFDLLLTAFSKLKHKENFRLILGGTGPEKNAIKQMISDFKLDPYIEMTGWVTRERLLQRHKEVDIFVQAHWRTDNTSISLSYAMAFGLPSILPGGGGLEWVAKKSALYFRDEDTDDLAAKIEQLGNNSDLRAELSRNCHKRLAEDEMSHKKQVGRLYERMRQLRRAE
ncbi:MAG: glycosyltransferase family 4 protein [bacterium]|nr:glycosyltransferase family 4 protein [bacterium]